MKNHQEPDWEKLISDTIESALHSGDFTQLKQTLGTTFETVKKQTAEGLKRIDKRKAGSKPTRSRCGSLRPNQRYSGFHRVMPPTGKGRPTGFSPSKKP